MKLKHITGQDIHGFTLIEVIIIIVVTAIMCAMLYSLMGTTQQSALPVGLVNDQYRLVQEMERMTSLYRETTPKNLTTFQSDVLARISYVDSSATGLLGSAITGTGGVMGGTYTTTQQVLRVTLRIGNQSVQAYFTQ